MVELVRQSIAYGMRQGSPVTRENVIHLNEFVQKLNFKDPRLWDSDFLDSLPSSAKYSPKDNPNELRTAELSALRAAFTEVQGLNPNSRGYHFERFLKTIFEYYGLDLGPPFDSSVSKLMEVSILKRRLTWLRPNGRRSLPMKLTCLSFTARPAGRPHGLAVCL